MPPAVYSRDAGIVNTLSAVFVSQLLAWLENEATTARPSGTLATAPLPTVGLIVSETTTVVVGTIMHRYIAVAERNQLNRTFQFNEKAMMRRL